MNLKTLFSGGRPTPEKIIQAQFESEIAELKSQLDSHAGPGAADKFLREKADAEIARLSKAGHPKAFTGEKQRLKEKGLPLFSAKAALKDELLRRLSSRPAPTPAPSAPATPEPAPIERRPAAKALDLDVLRALVDATFGRGMSARICQHPKTLAHGPQFDELRAEMERTRYAPYEHERASKAYEEARVRAEKSASAGYEAEDRGRLLKQLYANGIELPGLSYSGMRIPDRSEMNSDAKDRAYYQVAAAEFWAVITGSTFAPLADSDATRQAIRFMAERKGTTHFAVGDSLI